MSANISDATRRPKRPDVRLLILLSLALVLRLAVLFAAGVNAPLTGDELAYQQIAQNVAAGRGFVQTNNPFFPGEPLYAWQAPLYPLALSMIYFLVGENILLARLFTVILSTATVYLAFDLARRIFRQDEQTPLLAGLFVALYPGLLTAAHLLLSETLFTFLVILSFDLAVIAVMRRSSQKVPAPLPRHFYLPVVLSGVAWGLAALTRGIALYFAPFLALWLAFFQLARGDSQPPSPRRVAVLTAVLFFVSIAVVTAPWIIRNYSVFNQFVALETKGGVNLWLGNNPYTPSSFIRNVWKVGVREPMLQVLPQGEIARDRAAYALALDYVRREPATFIARMPVKFADFWGFERNLVDVAEATLSGAGWKSSAKLMADLVSGLGYVLLMLLALPGLVFAPDDRFKLLLSGWLAYFVIVHLVIFGDGRFHLPLIPVLALYAGWFLVHARRIRYHPSRSIAAVALLVGFILIWSRELAAAWAVLSGS